MATSDEPGGRPEKNTIEKDAKLIEKLVFSAKMGQWQDVWDILGSPESPKRDRLFNVIPEKRRWGILHQAVYWNNPEVLQKLLKYQACDSNIRAKQCTSECGYTDRMDPEEIAKAYGHTDIASILSKHSHKISEQSVPTFQSLVNYNQVEGLGLITVTLAAFKKTFHPNPIDPNRSLINVLEDIFDDIYRSDRRWREIKEKVCESIYAVCADNENYSRIKESENRQQFFQAIIKTYTMEENYMYTYLNLAFRRQRDSAYRPTGYDLSLGPYAVMYQMLLLFWPELPRESGLTHRKMLLSREDADQYRVGERFVWQSVVSSSTTLGRALPLFTCGPEGDQSVIFTIDNNESSQWQPRNIEQYSRYMEHERTYPAGATFIVKERAVTGSDLLISLTLLRG